MRDRASQKRAADPVGETAKNLARQAARKAADPEGFKEIARRSRRKRRGQIEPPTRPMPANCEVCTKPREGKSLHEEHDHDTGLFRGWACGSCNTAIGKLGDTEAGVMRAVVFLRAAPSRRILDIEQKAADGWVGRGGW
jgi:Recombination endonuclease VII